MTLVLRFAAGSHKGLIREGNEDSGYAGPRLLAVADGMGGAAAGEVASSEVLGSIVRLDEDVPGADLLTLLGDAVQGANDRLRQMVDEDPQLEGMGCTLTAMLWTGQRMGLVHVGDSRAYLLRDGSLVQITQDHTWVQRLVDEGRITPEEAETHPQRSLLMRALDGRGQVEPDLSIREVRAGDRYLICSDGLSGPVSHQTLQDTLGSYYSPEQTVQELIQLALRGGGPDNITCIVADVLDVGATDTLSGRFNDVPVVVGAVAETPPSSAAADQSIRDTPAGRAAGLGRGPQGAFGPAEGYGAGHPDAGFGPAGGYPEGGSAEPSVHGTEDYDEDDAPRRPRRKNRALAFSLVGLVTVGLLGAGGFFGYQWTQSQYYVGAEGDHVAVFQGVNQSLAGLSLSSVHTPYKDIELKFLPQDQRTHVTNTISATSLGDADDKVKKLGEQAAFCRRVSDVRATAGSLSTPGGTPATGQPTQQAAAGTVATHAGFVTATTAPSPSASGRAPAAGVPTTTPSPSTPSTTAPAPVPSQGAAAPAAPQSDLPGLSDEERQRADSCPKP